MRGTGIQRYNHPLFYPMKICEFCNNELVMELSLATGVCSHCREMRYPKYLHDSQWDNYWRHYLERKNER